VRLCELRLREYSSRATQSVWNLIEKKSERAVREFIRKNCIEVEMMQLNK